MPFTLTCHVCGQKLTLFDLDVKKRKGTIRCNHCGAKINYDLDQRKIQQSGFWAEREPAFDPRAKNRLMQQIEREEKRRGKRWRRRAQVRKRRSIRLPRDPLQRRQALRSLI